MTTKVDVIYTPDASMPVERPVFVPKGPSDPPPPCIEPQYLGSGRGQSSSRTPVGPS